MEMFFPILVIITGGTIDAEAYPDPAHPPKLASMLPESAVPAALAAMNLARKYYCYLWLRKDSKEFTEEDIAALARIIRQSGHQEVVITHGTDQMVENARLLADLMLAQAEQGEARSGGGSVSDGGKTPLNYKIAFTGSMIPLSNGEHSDGYRNLRYAMESVDYFLPGVWIAFEGQCFDPHRTIKDFQEYRFKEI